MFRRQQSESPRICWSPVAWVLGCLLLSVLAPIGGISHGADNESLLLMDDQLTTIRRVDAAREIWESAFRKSGKYREDLQLKAIESLLTKETRTNATAYLDSMIEWRMKDATLLVRRQVINAALAYLDGQPAEALKRLPVDARLPGRQRMMAMDIRARSLFETGSMQESLKLRSQLREFISDAQIAEKNERIMRANLTALSDEQLETISLSTHDVTLQGWIELILIEKAVKNAEELEKKQMEWSEAFPNHPAGLIIIPSTRLPPPLNPEALQSAGQGITASE